MLSSQQSYKQAILEAAQTTDKVSILGRIYYWPLPDKYAKDLFGDECDKTVLQKLKSQRSTRIMKVIFFSSVILLFSLGVGLGIGALVTEDPQRCHTLSTRSLCILWTIAFHSIAFLLKFEYDEEPLDIEASLSLFTRIEDIWSRRLWCFATLPVSACVLALLHHHVFKKYSTISDLIKSLKSPLA